MNDFKLFSADELVRMCREFIAEKKPPETPDPDHEGWDSDLVLTPKMVADILAANNEV